MGKRKHKHDSSVDAESTECESSKRLRQLGDNYTKNIKHGRVDPTFGQRSAIPGLEDDDEEFAIDGDNDDQDLDPDYGDSIDALSYLRAVRAEAFSIPSLIIAPQSQADSSSAPSREIYENGLGDSRGWYKDGAYTAAPIEPPSWSSSDSPVTSSFGRDPQLVYFEAILRRFEGLRQRLSLSPPRYAMERLDEQHVSHMIPSPTDWRAWKRRLENTEPEAAQLAAMRKDTVVRLLRMMVAKFLKGGGETLPRRTSRWIWGLLARLPGIGVLGSEEVGVVRDLGKRAVLVGMGLRGIDTKGLDGRVDDETIEKEEIVDVELQAEEVGTDEAESEDPQIIGPVLPSPDQPRQLPSSSTEPQATVPLKQDTDLGNNALEAARDHLLALLQDSDSEQQQLPGEKQEEACPGSRETEAFREETQEQEYEEEGKAENKADAAGIDDIQNTGATIDMILTIAGELYGQRDLLEFREVWE